MEIQAQTGLSRHDALAATEGLAPTAKNIERIAALYGQDAASWAWNQWHLRKRAAAKFSQAKEMLFTSDGLEQASHEAVAAYHASRFPTGALVADLTAGIGSDLRALSQRGPTIGFEPDAETADYARHNAQTEVRIEDCMTAKWDFGYAFADPARRSAGRRLSNPNDFSPDPIALAERLRTLTFAGMKLSPMLTDDFLANISPSIEFVSFKGECREAIAWFGEDNPSGFSARRIETGATLPRSPGGAKSLEPSEFFYEADPAAIRAHCLGSLCEMIGGTELGDSNGYLTSANSVDSEWLRKYKVLNFGAFDVKRARAALAEIGGGTPDVKARIGVDVADLRRKLSQKGDASPTIALYHVKKSVRYAILKGA